MSLKRTFIAKKHTNKYYPIAYADVRLGLEEIEKNIGNLF